MIKIGPSILLLSVLTWAQPLVGTWFSPGGNFRACLENPGLLCPQSSFGPSEQEKALHARAVSVLRIGQQGVMTMEDSTRKLTDVIGEMDFRMRFSTPLGTSVGLGVAVPYPRQRLVLDSTDLQTLPSTGQATLLLGSDLLSLNGINENTMHHLLLGFEIPIAYEPGLWESHLEWVWKKGFRARATVWSVAPRQELVSFDLDGPIYQYQWHERVTQALLAARPVSWLEVGLRGTRSQVEPRGKIGDLQAEGDVWQGAGSVQLIRRGWKWSQSLEWQREDLVLDWRENITETGLSDSSEPWAMNMVQKSDVWVYQTKLQRSIGIWKLSLWGERRWTRGKANAFQIEQGDSASYSWAALAGLVSGSATDGAGLLENNMIGTELRWNGDGFFVEPGVAWSKAQLDASENLWLTWGIPTGVDQGKMQFTALVGSINAGFSGGGNRFMYTWRQAFPLEGDPLSKGVNARWGAMHRFTLEGGF